jgi:alpha-mannosidase
MKTARRNKLREAEGRAAWLLAAVCLVLQGPARPDLSRLPTLYAVASAHLDSQWLWPYPRTIAKFLPRTMSLNFVLFTKYPHYIFNFSGANRYRMIKEYYPREYKKLKRFVAAGRWFPCGSSLEECDANIPAPESIIRQILYGGRFFRSEFGKNSSEFMLPDSFGFPASLPSILAHCGLKGFSTQKLYMGSAASVGGPDSPQRTPAGIPFNVGFWQGPDGKGVVAALNPGKYTGTIRYDLSRSPDAKTGASSSIPGRVDWPARLCRNGATSGLFADYMYYGTGDHGGAPREASVRLLEVIMERGITELPPLPPAGVQGRPTATKRIQVGTGPLRVVSATAEQMFLDIEPRQVSRLPRYQGELQLTNHSAGVLTSQAYVKRWNRRCEVLADSAEKAAVMAAWLGWPTYPQPRLNDAWTLALGAQFHDILAGTCSSEAYGYTWNDQVLAMNQFALVLAGSVEAVASAMDTRANGIPLLVFNSLEFEREDVVEAAVRFPGPAPRSVRVFAPDGREVPAQVGSGGRVIFLARVPAMGLAVYDVRSGAAPAIRLSPEMKATESGLENARYRVRIGVDGDVEGIYDKSIARELLSAPLHLEIKTDEPMRWPAWNMDWQDQARAPRSRVGGPARVTVVEKGPARTAVEIERRCEGSRFVQVVRLAGGDAGDRLEFANVIEWRTRKAHLKAVFPLSAANRLATYNLGVGTLERRGNSETQFEVGTQQWLDLTDAGGSFGVSVLTDCKYGSDKPDARTLRLTLLRTPGTRGGFPEQGTQDLGRHEFVYGLTAHHGDWRCGRSDRQAYRLNQPLTAFQAQPHAGALGRHFSFMRFSPGPVRLLALKKAEQGDEIIVRLVETDGGHVSGLRIRFAAAVRSAREVDGQEMGIGEAVVQDGELVAGFSPYQLRTFALKLDAVPKSVSAPHAQALLLACDVVAASRDGQCADGGMDGAGNALPAEMLPKQVTYKGVSFDLNGRANAVSCHGQTLHLPPGNCSALYLLAAAVGDQRAVFRLGGRGQALVVQDWLGRIGQWDSRLWHRDAPRARSLIGLAPGFIKEAPVAWFASHHHGADGANVPYGFCYMFAYELKVPVGARTLTLPDNPKVLIFAVSALERDRSLRPVQPLIDSLPGAAPGRIPLSE